MMKRRAALLSIAAFAAGGGGLVCRRPRSPEDQVRHTIAALVKAVEAQDLDAVRKLVSQRYRDGEDNDRASAMATLTVAFRRHPQIHLLSRTVSVEILSADEARATVIVAMAALPLKTSEDLARLHAEVTRFDLTLGNDAEQRWQVTQAAWDPAEAEDLFR
jgi:hypothetical protein